MAHQVAVTVYAPLRAGQLQACQGLLHRMDETGQPFRLLQFVSLPGVHFARVILLEDSFDLDGRLIPASVIYMADVDGTRAHHWQQLVSAGRQEIDQLFGHCLDYPVEPTDELRVRWLEAHHVMPAAYYVHCVGRTVGQIRAETQLCSQIEDLLDSGLIPPHLDPVSCHRRIVQELFNGPANRWASHRRRGAGLLFRLGETLHLIVLATVVLAAAPVLLPVAVVWICAIRVKEQTDKAETGQVDFGHLEAVRRHEDFGAQNPLTAVGLVKAGVIRRVAMRVGLLGLDYANRHIFNRDNLAGVRSIHFARWVPLDGGRRLIFASSYDGSAESYMDDFINQLHWGINLIFSNGVGFPATRWLVHGGAQNEIAYKNFLARHQIPTPVFYSAYPEVTAVNIDTHGQIRDGTARAMDHAHACRWLAML